MRHALKCLIERGDNARIVEHIERPAGALDRLFPVEHIGPARRHQHQVPEAHGLHGPGRGPHIAGVAGVDQNKACLHGLGNETEN